MHRDLFGFVHGPYLSQGFASQIGFSPHWLSSSSAPQSIQSALSFEIQSGLTQKLFPEHPMQNEQPAERILKADPVDKKLNEDAKDSTDMKHNVDRHESVARIENTEQNE